MKILLINTYDFGGAANACLRLHKGLLKQKLESNVLLKSKTNDFQNTETFQPLPITPPAPYTRIKDKIHRIALEFKLAKPKKEPFTYQEEFKKQRNKNLEMFSYPNSHYDITQSSTFQQSDIINLHWVADFLDWKSFFTKNTKPVVWTLHDQNPFLGGEHYPEVFLGIDEKGFPIKRKYTERELEEENKLLNLKKEILKNVANLHIVSPSKWLLEKSKKSELFSRYKHSHIPNGFPIDIFKPYKQKFCREVLGIPQDKKVFLFVSDSLENNRKGYAYLQQALENISEKYRKNLVLCAIGNQKNVKNQNTILKLGKIKDERLMAIAYSAADIFIIPSLEDNLPNTMIESILCGTPVIGFGIGGIPEVILGNQIGYLCPKISVQSLKETIEKFLENPNIFDREKIAQEARAKYALGVQAKKYIELYRDIFNNSK